jgi:nucleoside-diphosphate-sugar epimerase
MKILITGGVGFTGSTFAGSTFARALTEPPNHFEIAIQKAYS